MRSLQRIAEDQIRRASLRRKAPLARAAPDHPAPVVTVSREFGAGGEQVADAVAHALGFTF